MRRLLAVLMCPTAPLIVAALIIALMIVTLTGCAPESPAEATARETHKLASRAGRVDVWRDSDRRVTCWVVINGFEPKGVSCLPDVALGPEIGGQP